MVCNAKDENSIPKWLYENISTGPPSPEELREARDELYKALSLFQTHVRWLIGIMFSMFTATIAAIIARNKLESNLIPYLRIPAYVILVFTPFIAGLSILILYQYYSVYVSALIFAVRQHLISRDKNKHPWLNRTILQAKIWETAKRWKATTEKKFRIRRVLSLKDSFVLYAAIILFLLLIVVGCLIGFVLSTYQCSRIA